ncbi:DnaD domain-containing protein [Limosilactobacillus fastidiosus]|uniref:DnaD domain protein n=1 Tax=Limosilactobacillus fastidiosus TaxID=2759855 RepID=A0A7W3U0L8_9LACO|nr:DnaD domain protein [Limosilactobacillus fastidiosus]MBB1062800.1 DnaD domain protein [Limosilactobacillus fastidiosus]MBB1086465.1 DnaD domain protein [Limosilactobacillus fastidiosus]MCD7084787.1 DnaD domain protein [Limosilactobacillus fastidiosus]MCD7085183.1 DnaD domain protein [Limosilactobacillus fastidiosus]MCD7115053.1 DnaD domain protein [Limosilactobacillus fastidiosus]
MTENNPLVQYLNAGETTISNILLHHYHELGMSTAQLVVYLEFKSYLDRGIIDPDIRQIARHLQTDENQVFDLLHQMMSNKLVVQQMRKLADGKEDAFWDFTPLINKIGAFNEQEAVEKVETKISNQRKMTFNKIEAEVGRPLSPMEMQIVNDWIDRDHYSGSIIDLALRQAVMNNALSLQYMDRILRNWSRQGLKSVHDIQEHERRFEERKSQNNYSHQEPREIQGPKIPIFNLNTQQKNK